MPWFTLVLHEDLGFIGTSQYEPMMLGNYSSVSSNMAGKSGNFQQAMFDCKKVIYILAKCMGNLHREYDEIVVFLYVL